MKSYYYLLLLSITFTSCFKLDKPIIPANTSTKDTSVYNLTQITYNSNPLMSFKYTGKQITEATNTYYKDILSYKPNGQIDTVISYFNGVLNSIKRVSYGSNNHIASVICYSNKQLSASTVYTYDSSNRVIKISISSGASQYTYNYSYNSSGNETYYQELYSFNNTQLWSKSITTTTFDDKPNPFLTLKNFEYFFSNDYQSEYDRLGQPATLSKNNPVSATGTAINTTTSTGVITYAMKYDVNGYPAQLDYHSLVQGSLGVTYGFTYVKAP